MVQEYNGRQRSADGSAGPASGPRIPAERDESHDSQKAGQPRDDIKQAHEDVKNGQMNTDLYSNGAALNPLDKKEASDPAVSSPPLDPAPGKPKQSSDKR